MKKDKRKFLRWIAIVVASALLTTFAVSYMYGDALGYLLIRGLVFFGVREAQQMRVRLLCKTDHQALLEACRELSRQVATGDLKPGQYRINWDRHPEVSRFPKPILDLAPNYVIIDKDGRVRLEMHGGMDHFGVQAYTEDYKLPSYSKYGDKEVIDGLWYYDDGYRGHPEYEKRIEALLQKRK